MKKLILLTLFSVVVSFALNAEKLVKKGETQSALGSYVIEKTDDVVVINEIALPTYLISYQNSDQVVRVAVDKDKTGKNFIVLGDNLNLQYRCQSSHFGVQKLDKKYAESGISNTSENLNSGEYYHQKILTQSDPSNRDCLGLIACYYPKLVADYEIAFACVK